MAVVPGHYDGHVVPMNGALFNVALRVGTVQQVFFPEDEKSVSKKYMEYQVLVQHRANGTAVTKMYDHCIAIDHLASVADFDFATYRAENVATKQDGSQFRPGTGAHVVLLCLNGESNNALILGGIRHSDAPKDVKVDGHHKHARFNGIDLVINKDGELTVTYLGAQKSDGTKADNVEEDSLGTFVKISKDGNLLVSDKEGKNQILLDHATGKVQIVSENEVNVTSETVRLGDTETTDPAVLGNELKGLLEDIIKAINKLTVPTSTGPSGTPINAPEFSSISSRLGAMLSQTVFVKK
jgi:hypothetical protein